MDSNQNKCNTCISHDMLSMVPTTQVEVSISLIGVLILWGLCIYGRVEHKLESGMSGMNVLRNLDNRVFGEID